MLCCTVCKPRCCMHHACRCVQTQTIVRARLLHRRIKSVLNARRLGSIGMDGFLQMLHRRPNSTCKVLFLPNLSIQSVLSHRSPLDHADLANGFLMPSARKDPFGLWGDAVSSDRPPLVETILSMGLLLTPVFPIKTSNVHHCTSNATEKSVGVGSCSSLTVNFPALSESSPVFLASWCIRSNLQYFDCGPLSGRSERKHN